MARSPLTGAAIQAVSPQEGCLASGVSSTPVTLGCAVFTGLWLTAARTPRAIPGGVPMPRSAVRG
ncbi:hypothetical protein HD596_008297 [Nonomuraea jabiensis]|uniref:Uncharacterized protein n=1 Tax=Nonomuraea jabiensis TaxID=882448 RepID=A0A7W9LF49_9ACTN|nr:hypothetical protein [Nonomuraea jabiensis]